MSKLHFSYVLILSVFFWKINAQISGTFSVPASYATIASAINALNSSGVNGPVTILINSGYTETAPIGGYTLTVTGTAVNTITFKKNGSGANPIVYANTGGTGTPASAVQDGIWRFVGSDYVTIDGINLSDPNLSNPATMEFGFGFFKASATNGCQYNTIKNCNISLKRINEVAGPSNSFYFLSGSKGIEVVNATASSHTTNLTVTAPSGSNSYNKFYSNTIQDCHMGIAITGYSLDASPYPNADKGNDVGGSSSSTGNTIINFGGISSSTTAAAGIETFQQYDLNVGYNTINNNSGGGANHPARLYGIFTAYAPGANTTVLGNTVTVKSNGAFSTSCYAISNEAGSSTGTITASNNLITNCISNSSSYVSLYCFNFNSNNCVVKANGNSVLTNNVVNSGNLYGFNFSSNKDIQVTGNLFQNNNKQTSGGSGHIFGIYSSSSSSLSVSSNTIESSVNMNAGFLHGINLTGLSSSTGTVSNNVVRNLSVPNGGTITGVSYSSGLTASVTSNNVYNFSASNGGFITGIECSFASFSISDNNIYSFNNSGGTNTEMTGCYLDNLTGTNSIARNRIYDLETSSTSPFFSGIVMIGTGNLYQLQNNLIGDLRAINAASTLGVSGISAYGSITADLFYNSININSTSTSTLFGSSALDVSSSVYLTMRNNIFVNTSVPQGSGVSVALRRYGTSLSNYDASSNRNLFYTGTPSSTRLIYFDGTNTLQTLSAFKSFVSSREVNSITENPPFISVSGANSNFLNISSGVPTQIESGGVTISGLTTDYAGNSRSASMPDIGAWEGNYLSNCATISAGTITQNSINICSGQSATVAASGTGAYSNITNQWMVSSTGLAGSYANVSSGTGGTTTSYTSAPLSASTLYYYLQTGCYNTTGFVSSNIATVTVNSLPSVSAGGPTNLCSPSAAILTASGALTYTWSTGAISNSVSVSPTVTTVYTVTGESNFGCINTATYNINVSPTPTVSITGNTLICGSGNTTLTASGASTYSWSTGATTSSLLVNPSSNTVYTVTGISSSCGSQATVNVSVNALPLINISGNTSLCSGESTTLTASGASTYSWNTGALTNSIAVVPSSNTTYTVTGTDALGCPNTAVKTVSVNSLPVISVSGSNSICAGQSLTLSASGASTYTWNTGALTSTLTDSPTASLIYTVTGTNTLTGCSSAQTKSVTVNALPVLSITGNTSICNGQSTTLTAMGASSYTWNGSFVSTGITVNPSSTTTFTLSGTNANGCNNSVVQTVSVLPLPSLNIIGNAAICPGESTTLTVSGANSYFWGTGATTSTIMVSPTVNTIYNVTGTDINGCNNTTALTVTINPSPTLTVSNGTICPGFSYTLTPSGANSYTFMPSGPVVSPGVTTTYTVTGSSMQGCVSQTAVISVITVTSNINVSVTGSSSICAGQSTSLTANGAGTFTWSTGSNAATIIETPSVNTTYSVVGGMGTCTSSAVYNVTVNPLPTVVLTAAMNTICTNGFTVALNGMPSGGIYSGSNVAGNTFISSMSQGTYTPLYSYTNTLTGCSNTASTSIVVAICTDVSESNLSQNNMLIYPNPNRGSFFVEFDKEEIREMEISDLSGRIILVRKTSERKLNFELTEFNKGIYLLKIQSEKELKYFKIVSE